MSNEVSVSLAPLPAEETGTIVIYAEEGRPPAGAGKALWERTGLDFETVARSTGFQGKQGHMLDIVAPKGISVDRLVVLGRGKSGKDAHGATALADRGGSLMARLKALKARTVSVVLDEPGLDAAGIAEMAAGLRLRGYSFEKYRTRPKPNGENGDAGEIAVTFRLGSTRGAEAALADRMAVVEGTLLARTLVNEPPNVLGPSEFAGIASALSEVGVEVEVLTVEEMERIGMGALLAVGRGSERAPRLVVMKWSGGGRATAPLVVVGKGVVFDSGGVSLKQAASMEDMKGDMGGAAAVTGLMKALALRKAKANVVGVIGLVENMPDGRSYRPGDILKTLSGKTVEIVNTDAEGRLVLADALWYAQDRFRPKAIVDLATLTGAVLVALGHDHAGLFANDEPLAGAIAAAAAATGEKVWRLPLGPAYEKLIESRFADIKNSGGRYGGSITAAHFLQHFVNELPWAHLDIAGTAFGGPSSETNGSWGTGFGVALLDRLVRDRYEG